MEEKFKVYFQNIDQARREEAHEETKWDNRSESIKKLILDTDPDIIGLVELRDLETSHESARQFLSDKRFLKFDVVSRRYSHYDQCFQMALLFDPKKLFVEDVKVVNYTGNPENDRMVMIVSLQSKKTKKWFNLGLTHFGLDEEEKNKSVVILRQKMLYSPLPIMVYGDYNFFDDREGKKQRNYMLEFFDDLAYPLCHDDSALSGTFIGFCHDEQKKLFGKMSRLDHVFAPPNTFHLSRCAYSPFLDRFNMDNSGYDFNYPSDHLAICIEFTF